MAVLILLYYAHQHGCRYGFLCTPLSHWGSGAIFILFVILEIHQVFHSGFHHGFHGFNGVS